MSDADRVPKRRTFAFDSEEFEDLARMVRDVGSTLDVDQLLHNTARGLARYVDFDSFAVLLLDSLGRELYFRFGEGFTEEVVSNWRFGLGQGVVGAVAAGRKPARIADVKADDRYIGAAPGIRSELAVPLIVKQRVIGVLDVASNRPDHFTESDQRLLTFVAGHLGNAIDNARLYENVRDQARMLSLLHESSRKLTSILDRDRLLHKVGEMVKRLVDYQLFSVMLWNDEEQLLEHTFAMGFDEGFRRKGGFPLGHGVTGNCAALRRSVRVPNVHLNPHYTDCGHGVEVRSELAVPLVFKDRLVGVLDLESTEYNAFTEQHEQMLSTLASYIAVALENARLYERLAEDERRLERDLETAREMQSGLLPDHAPDVCGLDVGYAYKPARQLGGDFYDFLPYSDGRHAFAVGDVAGKGTPAALYASLAVGIVRGHIVEHPCEPEEMLADANRQLLSHRIDNRFVAMAFALYDPRNRRVARRQRRVAQAVARAERQRRGDPGGGRAARDARRRRLRADAGGLAARRRRRAELRRGLRVVEPEPGRVRETQAAGAFDRALRQTGGRDRERAVARVGAVRGRQPSRIRRSHDRRAAKKLESIAS